MSQNNSYPTGNIIPASTTGSQFATYVDALRDNLYSSHYGTALPPYTQLGMLWSKSIPASGQVSIQLSTSTTTSVELGVVDLTTQQFRVSGTEALDLLDITGSTAYSMTAAEASATIYEVTRTSGTSAATIIFPDNTTPKRLQFDNLLNNTLTVKSTSQVGGVAIPAGKTMLLYYNGTKIEPATSAYLTSASPTFTGTMNGPTAGLTTLSVVNFTIGSHTITSGAIGTYGSYSLIGSKGGETGIEYRSGTATGSSTVHGFIGYNTSTGTMNIRNAVGAVMLTCTSAGDLTATGDVTAFSDRKLKTNISTITSALDKVNLLRGVYFDRIDTGARSVGVIAQEVQKVIPEVVHTDEQSKLLHVAYGNIVGVLIEAIKELSDKVEVLENATRISR